MEGHKSVRVRITGRVQGVWFRAWTVQQARRLGLAGWVRNRSDGSVEALLSGPEQRVEEMIRLCGAGPSAARVDSVARAEVPAADTEHEGAFSQRPTE